MPPSPRFVLVGLVLILALAAQPSARAAEPAEVSSPAGPTAAILLPAITVEEGERRAPDPSDRDLIALMGNLDALLNDAAQDLGLSLDLTGRGGSRPMALSDADLVELSRTSEGTVIAPSLEEKGNRVELRLVVARPHSSTLLVRVERVERDDVPVRAAVMLRDLLLVAAQSGSKRPDVRVLPPDDSVLATPARSAGRAALAANATLFGGFVGYSILRSSGSEDPRLLYPLLAVGAGVGLGGSIIVAEEWDVGSGDAWFLSSGAWWPTLAGHLIYEGRFAEGATSSEERWAFGLVGGTAGISLATLGLTLHGASDGGAVVAHSGGGLGLVFGGLTELAVRGDIYSTPFAGMGYGAGFGWLAAAALSTQVHVPAGRVLTLDLGALLGGLGGAALASPLLLDDPSKNQQRAWLGGAAGGAVVGAGIAWYFSRSEPRASKRPSSPSFFTAGVPRLGVLGESRVGTRAAPIYGAGWDGRF